MTDKPTDEALENLFVEETGFATGDFPAAIFDFARAVLAKWGTPAPVGVGEVAERYRNAIASACEGWTMPDGLRKHLETALWSQPTPQPTQAQAAEPVAGLRNTTDQIADYVADNWPMRKYDLSEIEQRLRMLASAPSGPAREPLPKFLALKFHARRDKKATVTLLFPGHEAADAWVRGIKGGQHGTESST